MSLLAWLFLIPLITSFIAFLIPSFSKRLAISASLIPLVILLFGTLHGQEISFHWLPALSIFFHLKVDSLSLLFLYLTAITVPISLSATSYQITSRPHLFYGFVLLLEAFLIGFFTASDLFLFTVFWEAMLLPLYAIIAFWGGAQRQQAALKFIIYMIAGSFLMVAGLLALYFTSSPPTFDLNTLTHTAEHSPYAFIVFFIFLLAFAVKTPLFPFHAWLPDTYYQAPIGGTILLSAILSKAGIYGIVRIGLGIFPTYMETFSPYLLPLAIGGVLYGGFVAWGQNDFKRLLAYSSFSHVNFILAGLFLWSSLAQQGALLQAFNHGITIAGLFLVAGWLEERLNSTSLLNTSGLAAYFPKLCWITFVFILSSVALPATNNFVGEIMILFALFKEHPWQAFALGLTVILSVIYMLRWMELTYFQTPEAYRKEWKDIQKKEIAIALPLIALIFWVGLYPTPLLKMITETFS